VAVRGGNNVGLALNACATLAGHRFPPWQPAARAPPGAGSRGPARPPGHGRWAPGSPVVLSYIRAVDRWRDNALTGIGL